MLKAVFSDSTNMSAGIQMKNDLLHLMYLAHPKVKDPKSTL